MWDPPFRVSRGPTAHDLPPMPVRSMTFKPEPVVEPPNDPVGDGVGEKVLAEVRIYARQQLIASYAIEHGEYIIGRDATCDLMVDAEEVSRHHARLTFSAFELVIEDLASSNGIFIEGVQVQIPTRLRSDQEVQIGNARLRVQLKEQAEQQLIAAREDTQLGLGPVREMLSGSKYKVITTIARGGMGVVMHARDLRLRRTVAMKVMKTHSQYSRESVLRFIDEAQLTGQLEHPNIVPVYELAMDEAGETYYTMKYVKGITLDDVLRGLRYGNEKMISRYPLATLITIFQKICDAIAFAHSRGVVHRDLKPENVMIGAFGEVLVMDWGLAKNMSAATRSGDPARIETSMGEVPVPGARGFQTMHGLVVGTPPYISPEQARGEIDQVGPRSDIFVLGEILYAILTLRTPVAGSTVTEVIDNILASRITPPVSFNVGPKPSRRAPAANIDVNDDEVALVHCPGKRIPESLSAVAMKAMQTDAEKRYATVEEMQADITAHQGGFATKAERAGLRKQILLWAGRHKGEVTLFAIFAVFFHIALVTFFLQLKHQRDRAVASADLARASEQRALESEQRAAAALASLRQTAPTFASDAQALIEDLKFTEALEKIDYAIEQQPQHAEYYALKGNVLQSLLRFAEAQQAYETALRYDPKFPSAQRNLDLTKRLVTELGPGGEATPLQLRELHTAMLEQDRLDEAFALLREIGRDRELFRRSILEAFGRLGLRDRTYPNDDGTVALDLSGLDLARGLPGRSGGGRRGMSALRELRHRPISSLNLDATRTVDLSVLTGWQLRTLSINSNPVSDFTALRGMPLRSLSADTTAVQDLAPLAGLPIEILRLKNTRITSLDALRGLPLEQLTVAGCRAISDLAPLEGAPLQQLDLSRTSVGDLHPLVRSPLRELNLEGCSALVDLRPLLELKQLEGVIIPSHCKEIAFLRDHPTLKRLSYKKLTQPAAEFWQELDANRNGSAPESVPPPR